VGCYIWYSEEGTGRGRSPPRPLLAVPNVTAHPSTASVLMTVLLNNGRCTAVLMCPLKGLAEPVIPSVPGNVLNTASVIAKVQQ